MAQEEAKRLHEFEMYKLLIKATEDALSHAFEIGYVGSNDGLKNASFYYVEMILTEMVQRGALNYVFEQNLEKLTTPLTFMDAFTTQALTSSRFVLPVEKFIRPKVEKSINLASIAQKKTSIFLVHHQLLLLYQTRQ